MYRAAIPGISRLAVIAAIALAVAAHLHAQTVPARGLEFGLLYGRASGSTSFPMPITQTVADYESAQQTWGLHFGITTPDLLARDLGITIRAAYASGTATHTHHNPELQALIETDPASAPAIVPVRTDQLFEIRSWRLEVEGLARYSPIGNLSLLAGGAIGSLQVTNWKQSQKLISPANGRLINSDPVHYTLEDSGRTLVLSRGDVLPGENHLSLAGIAGVAYSLRLLHRYSITPELRLRYDLIEPGIVGAWRPLSIEGRVSIGLNEIAAGADDVQTSVNETPPQTDALPSRTDETPRAPEMPTVAIRLYSTDENGAPRRSASMHVVETIRSRTIDLPAAIPFETGSAELPGWLVTGPVTSIDSLARLHPSAAVDYLLAVAAARLAESPSVRLTLRGSTAEGEPASLAGTRSARIRRALIDGFGCRPSQIAVADGRTRSPLPPFAGVLLEEHGIATPFGIRTSWIERGYATSPIKVEPTIESTGEPRSWSIEFRQGQVLIARRTSGDTAGQLDLDVLFRNLSSGITPAPLAAELSVEDSSGRIASARDELPFELSPHRDTVYAASYVLLDADSTGAASSLSASLGRIASQTPPRASITIRPLRATPAMAGERSARRSAAELRRRLGPDARITIAGTRSTGQSNGVALSAFDPALDAGVEIDVTAPAPEPAHRP